MPDSGAGIVVLGASGLVGQGLMRLYALPGAVWVGRAPCTDPGYIQVPDYGHDSLAPLLQGCRAVVHLAAVTRHRIPEVLRPANVDLPLQVARQLRAEAPGARFVFLSSDLAGFPGSPYGRSKKEAEEGLLALGGDTVCLRASLVAVPPTSGRRTSLGSLRVAAAGMVTPIPGNGRFPIRPLWIGDLAQVLGAVGQRAGQSQDQGVWRCEGEAVAYRQVVLDLGSLQGRRPRLVPVPLALLRLAGRTLARLNPATSFPVDFLDAVGRPELAGLPDVFTHLGLTRTPLREFLPQV